MSQIVLDKDYSYVVLSAVFMAFGTHVAGAYVAKARKKVGLVYPDMGDGRFAQKLSEAEWKWFMCHQRSHLNYLEQWPVAFSGLALGGLHYPRLAASVGVVWTLGRLIYMAGYNTGSPGKRAPGAAVSLLSQVVLICAATWGSVKSLGYL